MGVKYTSMEDCENSVNRLGIDVRSYCLPEWDNTVCWPLTAVNESATLQCPRIFKQFDHKKTFSRFCQSDGTWEAELPYSQCFRTTIPIDTFTDNSTKAQLEFYKSVISGAKLMELVGLFLSWTSLVAALFIFYFFRNLRCHRTKIHQHLFIAFVFRLTLKIILDVDRYVSKSPSGQGFGDSHSIQHVPPLCKTFEVLREYTRLCTFAWMFIEGVYLNTLLSSAVFGSPKFVLFYVIGWAFPIPLVIAWAIAMDLTKGKEGCWLGDVVSMWYWIFIEIPRNLMILANVLFLFNIIRVLVTKLRESNTSETQQVRKALKAAIVLLPLLGIANLVWLIPIPTPTNDRAFILVYNYLFLFLDAYQGFFVAVLYCFVNSEVRATLKRKWAAWRNSRRPHHHRGHSVVTTATDIRMSLFDNGHVPTET
ncbi:PDF receptor-like [Diadema antillarum]|uniref:PDF receptor-like n=1 Tax=Diadema antillarum TaxID=105358 RepID=UPI003A84A385